LVKVVDELGGAEYWQRAAAARAAARRSLYISSVEMYCERIGRAQGEEGRF
jgi:hypothetical protein